MFISIGSNSSPPPWYSVVASLPAAVPAHAECTQLRRHIFLSGEHFFSQLFKVSGLSTKWIRREISIKRFQFAQNPHYWFLGRLSATWATTLKFKEAKEESHQFWSTAISSQERLLLGASTCHFSIFYWNFSSLHYFKQLAWWSIIPSHPWDAAFERYVLYLEFC